MEKIFMGLVSGITQFFWPTNYLTNNKVSAKTKNKTNHSKQIHKYIKRCFAYSNSQDNQKLILQLLDSLSPQEIVSLKKDYLLRYKKSLRRALNEVLSWSSLKVALHKIEDNTALALKQSNNRLHDLYTDPTGLSFTGSDGRIPQVIDKLLCLRKEGVTTDCDLINYHELTNNNSLQLHIDGSQIFPAIFRAIKEAKDSIHVSFFLMLDDKVGSELADLLIAKAKSGVKVRIMLDRAGSHQSIPRPGKWNLVEKLKDGGVQVITNPAISPLYLQKTWLMPPDHRKIVVIDGKKAFTGGCNVADRYRESWHDFMVEITGSAVKQIQAEWMMSWLRQGGKIDPQKNDAEVVARYFPKSSETYGNSRVKIAQAVPSQNDEIRRSFLHFINNTKGPIYIESPYFTSSEIFSALIDARARDVEVNIIIPKEIDSKMCQLITRSYYHKLLKHGVNIYETEGMTHGKIALFGDNLAIGSSNMDGLSLFHIREMNLHTDDKNIVEYARKNVFEKDIKGAQIIESKDVKPWQWLLGSFMSFFGDYI